MSTRSLSISQFLKVIPRHALHNRWAMGQEYTGGVGGNCVLWLVTKGKIHVEAERGHWVLDTGTAFLFALQGQRRIIATEDSEWFSVGLRATVYDSLDLLSLLPLPIVWKPDSEEFSAFFACCNGIARDWGGPHYAPVNPQIFGNYLYNQGRNFLENDTTRALLCEGYARAIFALCWRRWSEKSLESTVGNHLPDWMPVVFLRLRENPGISVEQLAQAVNISRRQLGREFQANFGVSPREFLNRRRLEEARQLLENTDAPLNEIARQTGFADVSYFNRLFKSTFGVPPEAYRNQSRPHDITI
jgi:AraC-like DNA-binding protein